VDTLDQTSEAVGVLRDLYSRGYRLTVRTRVERRYHRGGAQATTYADKLQIRGDDPLPPDLHKEIALHRDELLAAACVLSPPVAWMGVLVARYRSGETVEARRDGWKGPYRVRLGMVAANVASFIGLEPTLDGPHLEEIIGEALR